MKLATFDYKGETRIGVVTGDGTVVRLAVQTICLHGDGPSAMEAARRVRARFEQEGITISAFAKG